MDANKDTSRLLSPAEQAARLGIARTTLLGLVRRERLPAIRLSGGDGRRRILRFDPEEVSRWLRRRYEHEAGRVASGGHLARQPEQP